MKIILLHVLIYLFVISNCRAYTEDNSNVVPDPVDTLTDHSKIYDPLNLDVLERETYTVNESQERALDYYKTQIEINAIAKKKLQNVIRLLGNTLLYFKNLEELVSFIKCDHCGPQVPKLSDLHVHIKQYFLLNLKTLLTVAPNDVKEAIPLTIADTLTEFLEMDDDVGVKAKVLQVMNVWLPGNPAAQVRVIEHKGLEPFYNQVAKLDTNGVYTFFELFSKILVEHAEARDLLRNKRKEKPNDKLHMYDRAGLIEQLSNPKICYGLITFLKRGLAFEEEREHFMAPTFKCLKFISQPCMGYFRKAPQSGLIFKTYLDYASTPDVMDSYEKIKVNMTDVLLVLNDYVDELRIPKNEL